MSAPETRVRIQRRASDDTYYAECDACRHILATGYVSVANLDLALSELDHESACSSTQLARLQARWDARNEALRALVEQWRRRVDDRLELAAASDDRDQYDGFVSGVDTCADELERAIGDGRG